MIKLFRWIWNTYESGTTRVILWSHQMMTWLVSTDQMVQMSLHKTDWLQGVLTFQILSSRFGEETNKHMPSFCSDDDDSSKLYWNLFTSEGNVSQFYTKNASCWTLLLLRIEKRIEKKFNTSNYLGELLSGELIRVQI